MSEDDKEPDEDLKKVGTAHTDSPYTCTHVLQSLCPSATLHSHSSQVVP